MTIHIAAGRSARITSDETHEGVPRPHLLISTALFVFSLILLLSPSAAMAGKASSGELAFYPCTRCHPIGKVPAAERPNKFKRHQIKLETHNVLARGDAACLVCHDSPKANPGKLKLIDGSLIDITGNVSLACYRCHSAKYIEWKAGFHGKPPKCTTAGCHNPHSPRWIAIPPLLPFIGTTIEVRAVGEREPFKALPGPPSKPESPDFVSVKIVTILGILGSIAAFVVPAKRKRKRSGGVPRRRSRTGAR